MNIRLGVWLRKKRNFLIFSVLAAGLPFTLMLFWQFGRYVGFRFDVFMFATAICGGLLWGIIMREYFARLYPSLRRKNEAGRQQ